MERNNRWQRYIDAAVGHTPDNTGTAVHAAAGPRQAVPRRRQVLRGLLPPGGIPGAAAGPGTAAPEHSFRRTDVRLVPPAAGVWAMAAAGHQLPPAVLAAVCAALVLAAGLLLLRMSSLIRGRPSRAPSPRSFHATMAVALLLAAAAGGHGVSDSSRRHEGAVAAAAAAHTTVAATVEVEAAPRRLKTPARSGLADRWAVPVSLFEMSLNGHRVRVQARLLILGGAEWEHAAPGQRIRTTGKLNPPGPGQPEAAVLSASSTPLSVEVPGPLQHGPRELRQQFTAAAAHFGTDARGLLPGMVTGDTSALDAELDTAMKSVGMTHLTAVSGANCSLILGALMLAARSVRCSRASAAVLCLGGLGLFVLVVGPEPSVLRAAVMGAVGLLALAGGRPGRGLSFLCLAVVGLLLAEPGLSISFGFLLSVLATLGIVLTGRTVMAWFPAAVPRWLAAGVAVPLSAQAFCGPAIVLLQPQFSTYALPANMAAAVLVAPVTLLGTAALPLVPLAPFPSAVPLGVAAGFAAGVGAIARFFAGLPGAVLPWPEGPFGAATMALLSACTLAGWWVLFHPGRTVLLVLAAHQRTVALLSPNPYRAGGRQAPGVGSRSGLVHRPGRGRLSICKQFSGRKPQWLLPRPRVPGPPRRTPPPGAT